MHVLGQARSTPQAAHNSLRMPPHCCRDYIFPLANPLHTLEFPKQRNPPACRRDHILPLADVIVPNQFEAELLADRGHIRSVVSPCSSLNVSVCPVLSACEASWPGMVLEEPERGWSSTQLQCVHSDACPACHAQGMLATFVISDAACFMPSVWPAGGRLCYLRGATRAGASHRGALWGQEHPLLVDALRVPCASCSLCRPTKTPHSLNHRPCVQIITSMTLESEPGAVLLIASTKQPQAQGPQAQRLTLRIPRIDAYYTGTGTYCAWAGYVQHVHCTAWLLG